ncbi:MAG: hypothetical protein IKY77_00890 [Methanocorpusculaceae archaeon]|nr:hypothetical protein [Methanocorpusculaceae archaeon]
MKYRLAVVIFCLIIIFSAGCISLGEQTTDIKVGENSVGTVTLSPQNDGTITAYINIFGMTFTKEGLSVSEAENLADSAGSGNIFETIGLQGIPENAGAPTDIGEFLESIKDMPLTNSGEGSLADNLNFTLAAENAEQSFEALEDLIGKFI